MLVGRRSHESLSPSLSSDTAILASSDARSELHSERNAVTDVFVCGGVRKAVASGE
jgi:hypothetical protein